MGTRHLALIREPHARALSERCGPLAFLSRCGASIVPAFLQPWCFRRTARRQAPSGTLFVRRAGGRR
jgi:hypothetical protein